MEKICVFDVNGTLLDLSALDEHFGELFERAEMRPLWFHTVLQTASALTLTGRYEQFRTIAAETLKSLARDEGTELSTEQMMAFQEEMKSLPAFEDVAPSLEELKRAGYRLIALSNSGRGSTQSLLKRLGLASLFEEIFSADTVKSFKPARAPYELVARTLGLQPKQLWMVSAHAWDTAGARQVGYKTALLLREGHGSNDCYPEPDVFGKDLTDVSRALRAHDGFPYGKVKGTSVA